MNKKSIIYFSIFVLVVCCTAIFFIYQIKNINTGLDRISRYAGIAVVSSKKSPVYLEDFSEIRENLILAKSDFLEANLPEMKIFFYQAGILKNEFPILAKGDPQGWGGSAAGLYQVISGNKTSYSIVADVYMPYALRYYGKYYIHGEPYYANGEKRYATTTGGCIQLSDQNAKAIFNLTEIGMPLLVVDKENDDYTYSTQRTSRFPQTSAKNYLVADLDSGFVFADKDSKTPLPIASLTKLMTAVVLAENVDLRKSIQITYPMLAGYGSTTDLDIGRSFRVVEFFYPLLVESSNDAAYALSYYLGKEKTVQLMNEKAKSILMENTKFVGTDGFSSENVSTSQDLFYLARYILDNRPPLLEITKNKEVKSFGEISFKNLDNKNIFFENSDFIGGKTGYITASRNTGIFVFKFSDKNNSERRIVVILLGSSGSDNLKSDTEKINGWLKENYF